MYKFTSLTRFPSIFSCSELCSPLVYSYFLRSSSTVSNGVFLGCFFLGFYFTTTLNFYTLYDQVIFYSPITDKAVEWCQSQLFLLFPIKLSSPCTCFAIVDGHTFLISFSYWQWSSRFHTCSITLVLSSTYITLLLIFILLIPYSF